MTTTRIILFKMRIECKFSNNDDIIPNYGNPIFKCMRIVFPNAEEVLYGINKA